MIRWMLRQYHPLEQLRSQLLSLCRHPQLCVPIQDSRPSRRWMPGSGYKAPGKIDSYIWFPWACCERGSSSSSIPNADLVINNRPSTISTVTRQFPTTTNSQSLTTPRLRPQYSGAGNLLTSTCAQAEYTPVDAGSSLYYVLFIGCTNQKPDCCPFALGPTTGIIYPQPLNNKIAFLEHCPSDYHSVSGGGCCPRSVAPLAQIQYLVYKS